MTFKEKIYRHYFLALDTKITMVQDRLQQLAESLEQETKSTVGDKHETARAFVHIEQANVNMQLLELQEQRAAFKHIDITMIADHVIKGSLVLTNKGWFFVSVALGKAVIEGKAIFALSPASPLGKQLMGLKTGESAFVKEHQYTINAIC